MHSTAKFRIMEKWNTSRSGKDNMQISAGEGMAHGLPPDALSKVLKKSCFMEKEFEKSQICPSSWSPLTPGSAHGPRAHNRGILSGTPPEAV
jgi:hypothetical protein